MTTLNWYIFVIDITKELNSEYSKHIKKEQTSEMSYILVYNDLSETLYYLMIPFFFIYICTIILSLIYRPLINTYRSNLAIIFNIILVSLGLLVIINNHANYHPRILKFNMEHYIVNSYCINLQNDYPKGKITYRNGDEHQIEYNTDENQLYGFFNEEEIKCKKYKIDFDIDYIKQKRVPKYLSDLYYFSIVLICLNLIYIVIYSILYYFVSYVSLNKKIEFMISIGMIQNNKNNNNNNDIKIINLKSV